MLTAQELRIGNLIRDQHGDYVEVIAINKTTADLLFEDMEMEGIDLSKCSPMEIDETWLQRFGFSSELYNNEIDYREMGLIKLRKQDIELRLKTRDGTVDFYQDGDGIKAGIKYIHRLQNLFFEIKDTELTLT